jgi:pentatricopeptide repeat protein
VTEPSSQPPLNTRTVTTSATRKSCRHSQRLLHVFLSRKASSTATIARDTSRRKEHKIRKPYPIRDTFHPEIPEEERRLRHKFNRLDPNAYAIGDKLDCTELDDLWETWVPKRDDKDERLSQRIARLATALSARAGRELAQKGISDNVISDGKRIEMLVKDAPVNFHTQSWLDCANLVVCAISGDWRGVERWKGVVDKHRDDLEYLPWQCIHAFNITFMCLRFRHPDGVIAAIRFLLDRWDSLGKHLVSFGRSTMAHVPRVHGDLVRQQLFRAFDVDLGKDIYQWYRETVSSLFLGADSARLAQILFSYAVIQRHQELAWSMYRYLKVKDIPVPEWKQLWFSRFLAMRKSPFESQEVLLRAAYPDKRDPGTPPTPLIAAPTPSLVHQPPATDVEGPRYTNREALSSAAFAAVMRNDRPKALTFVHGLIQRGWARHADMRHLVSLYTHKPDMESAEHLIELFINSRLPLLRRDYLIMTGGYSTLGDPSGVMRWIQRMREESRVKEVDLPWHDVLRAFVKTQNAGAITRVLQHMQAIGAKKGIDTYRVLMWMMLDRRDPLNAERVFRAAIRDGIKPDIRLIQLLIQCHVNAGSWKGVIRAFDWIRTLDHRKISLDVEIYNVALQAYVSLGTPYSHVAKLFTTLIKKQKLQPNWKTYEWLIISACDSGELDAAAEIFVRMEEEMHHFHHYRPIFALSAIMDGFLKIGKTSKAKEIYDDIVKRRLKPTAFTYSLITRSYTHTLKKEQLEQAEKFITSVTEPEDPLWDGYTNVSRALQTIYSPLMLAYVYHNRPELVESLFEQMLNAGGDTNLQALTMMMDVHRRVGNYHRVLELWKDVKELGRKIIEEGEDVMYQMSESVKRRSRLLSPALSIYIDAASASGDHQAVEREWTKFNEDGFIYDSHNWNHLALALLRGGRVLEAFQVVEYVLLYHLDMAQSIVWDRDLKPKDPFSYDDTKLDSWTPFRHDTYAQMESRAKSRMQRAKMMKPKIRLGAAEQFIAEAAIRRRQAAEAKGECVDEGNFVHELHILHQVSASWRLWRPHQKIMKVLQIALSRLERGTPVLPHYPPGVPRNRDLDVYFTETVYQTYAEVMKTCPRTVDLVMRLS